MSFSAVQAALSGLRSCQEDLGTSMDLVTDVAMDLMEEVVEAHGEGGGDDDDDDDGGGGAGR